MVIRTFEIVKRLNHLLASVISRTLASGGKKERSTPVQRRTTECFGRVAQPPTVQVDSNRFARPKIARYPVRSSTLINLRAVVVRSTYIWALVIIVVAVGWLLTGVLGESEPLIAPSLAEKNSTFTAKREDAPARVRARIIQASMQTEDVVVRAITMNKRMVEVKAMVAGRVAAAPVEQGSTVDTGALLCQLETADRRAWVAEGEAAVVQARLEYEGTLKLRDRGYQSEMQEMTAKARLASATAGLQQRQIELERTSIRAPFPGVVEVRHAELGAFLQPGALCVTLVAPHPMLIVGRVAEKDVGKLEPGIVASALLGDGRRVEGTVSFVASAADEQTRTYRVEITVPNETRAIRSGLTADLRIPDQTIAAHRISPAVLALDDAGGVGVRIVDVDQIVRMLPVQVIKNDPDGVWVTGLPEVATVITVGQETVVAGEPVEVVYDAPELAPAGAVAVPDDVPDAESAGAPTQATAEVASDGVHGS